MRPVFCLFLLSMMSCSGQPIGNKQVEKITARPSRTEKIQFRKVEILLQYPADSIQIKGDLLLLPGWNFSNTKWCDSTDVCQTALKKGYRVIAPQMGQSIYASHYFPETRADLRKYPTLLWLDSAIQYLSDSLKMFQLKKYVLGLSTGARGVALICEKRSRFFNAAAALSGDYNQVTMPNDGLCLLVYGPWPKFKERWRTTDNPTYKSHDLLTPIYLGHGNADQVVPVSQTVFFIQNLLTIKGNNKVISHIDPKAGHNFTYWRSELPAIWAFFEKH